MKTFFNVPIKYTKIQSPVTIENKSHPRYVLAHRSRRPRGNNKIISAQAKASTNMLSEAEIFTQDILSNTAAPQQIEQSMSTLSAQRDALRTQVSAIQATIDESYRQAFNGISPSMLVTSDDTITDQSSSDIEQLFSIGITESSFGELGRLSPVILQALLKVKETQDPKGWLAFQTDISSLKLQRSRLDKEIQQVTAAIDQAEKKIRAALSPTEYESVTSPQDFSDKDGAMARQTVTIVLITGFESFNVELYQRAAVQLSRACPHAAVKVFSDRDIEPKKAEIDAALTHADVFFGSLLFDFDQVEWLKERIDKVPVRFVFESSLELMSSTRVGGFQMAPGGKSVGPPTAVKKVLQLFGSGREEDKLVGYLSFLKVGPTLLKFLPGKKVKDLRTWLTVYSYWNQGGLDNVVSMFQYILRECFVLPNATMLPEPAAVVETPATGCIHPLAQGRFFKNPSQYMSWYKQYGPVRDPHAPVTAVLLYRKHVITQQPYINDLISCLEDKGLIPVPIFINGVEAHTVVRDMLTTTHERSLLAQGQKTSPTLNSDAVLVDAIVNTIGFPLVGGPAGTMEGGRQADVAKSILSSKNVPYVVAAPLLIQDLNSWINDGIGGLQSVVLYALPELDGAIDTVPLGGLVGDSIYVIPERVERLANRLQKWIQLRRTPTSRRKLAVMLYGFPPGVGAAGTAALLNVPKSLEFLLKKLRNEGYDLGDAPSDIDGEAIIAFLRDQMDESSLSKGSNAVIARGAPGAKDMGAHAAAVDVSAERLKEMLTYPPSWGPTEWGPIPFLPSPDILVQRMERQWGELSKYRAGLSTSIRGDSVVSGLQFGNVFFGIQPLLGVEGDPMRLLFERDLTPHPQYAAFYKWLQHDFDAHAVLHFGMHGTVEWLPGAPLGNSGFSWSDVLLGNLPNVYVYAANNPSESIVAKRRGYGTIISHNVPPYGRAGLYKQMAELKALLSEYRESGRDAPESVKVLRTPIVELVESSGLGEDCPFILTTMVDGRSGGSTSNTIENISDIRGAYNNKEIKAFTVEAVDALDDALFDDYISRLYTYLQEVENRLYSEGLHKLGAAPTAEQAMQYLSAYFGDALPEDAIHAVVHAPPSASMAALRASLSPSIAVSLPGAASPSGAASFPPLMSYAESMLNMTSNSQINGTTSTAGCESESIDSKMLEEALHIRNLLNRNTEELDSLVRALNGEYILPASGGDLLRDGAGVLPTGRNIHALDPYRMPSQAAMQRGAEAAEKILEAHRRANNGAWPETVAVNLWGLDAIKTKGESVGIALTLIGARPVKEGTGRIARFELMPLEELGRPRIDVLCNMSGIFRDSFANVVELLDDAFQRAAAAVEEPDELNYVKKHASDMAARGLSNPAARLFSNPAGDYGSMVNERVGASNWEDGDELASTWAARNSFSYGRGGERGTARPEVLQALLATTDRVVQEIDSVEYGLTDIQEYYANTGALRRAAQAAKGDGGAQVGCSIVEAFSKQVNPKELEEVLRLEYRSKLLNPKWAAAMAASGSGGAFEISQRMTAMIGWGATVDFKEDWTWNQAAETYVFDEDMAATLRKSNPQAFANVLKRMLEAAGRGMWSADEETLEKLRAMYSEMDQQLEGVI